MAFVDVEIAGEHFDTQVVVASALTTEALLGGDFLRDNQRALEIGQRQLRFGSQGVGNTMDDISFEPMIVQTRVTLDELSALRIVSDTF